MEADDWRKFNLQSQRGAFISTCAAGSILKPSPSLVHADIVLFKHGKYSVTFWFVWRTIESECVFLSRMTTSKMGRRTRRLMKVSQRTVNFVQLATFFGARARLTIQNCFKRLLCFSDLA